MEVKVEVDWRESKEWKEILSLLSTRRIPGDGVKKLQEFYFAHKELTPYDFELEFRKKVPYFRLFAEDPKLTKFWKGHPPFNQNDEIQPYLIVYTTKDLKDCRDDFSEQCFKEDNLEKLKKTGFPCITFEDSDIALKLMFESMGPCQQMVITHRDMAMDCFNFLKKDLSYTMFLLQSGIGFIVSDEVKKSFEENPPEEFKKDDKVSKVLVEVIKVMGWIK